MKFAVSIGLPVLAAASRTSKHAVSLAMYKALAINCAIDFTLGSLGWPKEYERMDQTEKANISYWTGMTFASLLADECLSISRLVHAAAFSRLGLLTANPTSRRLADLVGQDKAGDWHVIESKARQAEASIAVRADWKAQANTVAMISGAVPVTHSYSFTHVGQIYSAELMDPPPDEQPPPVELRFESGALAKGYYGAILDWLSEGGTNIERGETQLVVKRAAFDPVDNEFVFLGLTDIAMKTITHNQFPPRRNAKDLTDTYIGSDGLAVVTSPEPLLE
jgi:hypothetical protein